MNLTEILHARVAKTMYYRYGLPLDARHKPTQEVNAKLNEMGGEGEKKGTSSRFLIPATTRFSRLTCIDTARYFFLLQSRRRKVG